MNREITSGDAARAEMAAGVDAVANAVKVTLGGKGRNAIIDKPAGLPQVTKDGVTVAKSIFLEDRLQNMGAQLVKDVASKTANDAGDGTSTATVIAQSIITEGLKNLTAGSSPIFLKEGIDRAVKFVVEKIKEQAIPCAGDSDIISIANISANNDEIGKIVGEAMSSVGVGGMVSIDTSDNAETYVKQISGMEFDNGYISPYFRNTTSKVEYDNPYILLADKSITSGEDVYSIMEKAHTDGRPLVIICDDMLEEALSTLVVNKIQNGARIAAVKAPMLGVNRTQSLEDIAVFTGGYVYSEGKGDFIKHAMTDQCGGCEKIIITQNDTTIIGGHGEKEIVQGRVDDLNEEMKLASNRDKKVLGIRLMRLTDSAAVLYVGAMSDAELSEKKDRIDDAICATRAAMEEGIVVGGGVTLARLSEELEALKSDTPDIQTGINIIKHAMLSPIKQIAENAGVNGDVVVENVKGSKSKHTGYNALTNEYTDLYKLGIIDPAKVTRVALENASSVAGLFLTTECAIVLIHDNKTQK